jgi:hypothetical protein
VERLSKGGEQFKGWEGWSWYSNIHKKFSERPCVCRSLEKVRVGSKSRVLQAEPSLGSNPSSATRRLCDFQSGLASLSSSHLYNGVKNYLSHMVANGLSIESKYPTMILAYVTYSANDSF